MSKTFRPYEPEQNYLMPVSLKEWLPKDHLVYFLSDIVDQLDLSEIMDSYEQEERGYPPYHPRMMVKVLLLHRGTVFPKDCWQVGRRYCFSSAGG